MDHIIWADRWGSRLLHTALRSPLVVLADVVFQLLFHFSRPFKVEPAECSRVFTSMGLESVTRKLSYPRFSGGTCQRRSLPF